MRFVMALLLCLLGAVSTHAATRPTDDEVKQIVTQEVANLLRGAGAAVAVRIDGRTLFFNFGFADRASGRPVTSGSVFNLASVGKVFDATLLALMVRQGEVSFDDTVGASIDELRHGGDIRDVTLGELITFTSGFRLPQDHPPFPPAHFTLASFLRCSGPGSGSRITDPDNTSIRTPAPCCCTSRWSAGSAFPTRLCWRGSCCAGSRSPQRRCRCGAHSPPGSFRLHCAAASCRAIRRPAGRGKPGDVQGHYYWPGRAAFPRRATWRHSWPRIWESKSTTRCCGRRSKSPIARSPRFARTSPRRMPGKHITDR